MVGFLFSSLLECLLSRCTPDEGYLSVGSFGYAGRVVITTERGEADITPRVVGVEITGRVRADK